MKPSERRALIQQREQQRKEAEKEAEREAREQGMSAQTPKEEENAPADSDRPIKTDENGGERSKGKARREGFFQSNVKLITFLITVSVLLLLIGPYNIYDMVKDISERADRVTDRQALTMDDVYKISEYGDNISWASFNSFNYIDQSFKTSEGEFVKREYAVKGTNYAVLVGGKGLKEWPAYVYLIDYESGELADIRREDARKFVEDVESIKQEQKEK